MASVHPDLLKGLKKLGSNSAEMEDKTQSACHSLISVLYGGSPTESLDSIRYELFAKKSYSNEKLPPTTDAFQEHLKRANYQTFILAHATQQYLKLPSPETSGWMKDGQQQLVPRRMSQPAAPDAVLVFVKCGCKSDYRYRRCGCRKEDMMCTDACSCDSEQCINRVPYKDDTDTDD